MIWKLFSCEDNYGIFCWMILGATYCSWDFKLQYMKSSSEIPKFNEIKLQWDQELSYTPYDMSLSCKCYWYHLCDFDIKSVNVSIVPMFFKLLLSFFFKDFWKWLIHHCRSTKTIYVQKEPLFKHWCQH